MSCKRIRILKAVNDVDDRSRLPSAEKPSGTLLRAERIVPRSLIASLPDEVVTDLHERLDRNPFQSVHEQIFGLKRFETAVIERLFPIRDERRIFVRLRLHSQVTAIAATVVAQKVRLPTQAAYVGGWLHDLGIASCLQHIDDGTPQTNALINDAVWKLILYSAPQHAVHLASRWCLPSAIRYALREHAGYGDINQVSPNACVLYVAEHLAALQNCGFRDELPIAGLRSRLNILGLDDRALLPLARDVERRIGHIELEWRSLKFFGRD
jgi:hypothetical protein